MLRVLARIDGSRLHVSGRGYIKVEHWLLCHEVAQRSLQTTADARVLAAARFAEIFLAIALRATALLVFTLDFCRLWSPERLVQRSFPPIASCSLVRCDDSFESFWTDALLLAERTSNWHL
jgi:hypothetical protein